MPNKDKKKRFRFPNGISTVRVPFILCRPWEECVGKEIKKMEEKLGTSKTANYGYKIENGFAEVIITKSL